MAQEAENNAQVCGYCLAVIPENLESCKECGGTVRRNEGDWQLVIAIAAALLILIAAQWR